MRGSASPKGEARRERAAKAERSEGRGGTLPTRVRVMPNYGWGWAGRFDKNLPTPLAFAGAGAVP